MDRSAYRLRLTAYRLKMNLPEKSALTDAKYQEILVLIKRLGVNLADIDEKFVRAGGRGGQKINKTSSAVQLKHLPTGTLVKFQKFRERSMNRILALRELLRKLDPDSEVKSENDRVRKQKMRRKRRNVSARGGSDSGEKKHVKMP